MEVENFCRTCSNNSKNFYSLFEIHEDRKLSTIIPLISYGVTIEENDGLPMQICVECRTKVMEAYNFRQQCLDSEAKLRTLFGSQQLLIKTEPEVEIFENDSTEDNLSFLKIEAVDICVTNKLSKSPGKSRPRRYPCSVCDKVLQSPSNLARHLKTHKSTTFNETNELDEISEPDSKIDDTPKRTSSKSRKNLCDKCNLKFNSKSAFKRHMFIHSEAFERSKIVWEESHSFICCICSENFKEYDDLLTHMKNHKDSNDHITCQLCLKQFANVSNIIKHSKTHDENATHQCIKCNRKYGYGNDFIDHMMKHEDEASFHCDLCSKTFSKMHKLKKHMLNHSGAPKPHLCSLCGRGFAEADYLRRHMVLHSGIKAHKCPLCPSSFAYRGGLTSHMKTHSGLKPYVCNICGSSFTREDTMKKHIFKHSNEVEKRYHCDVCGKGFVAPFNLRTHMRIHTGEKPFACEYCDRSYSQKNDLVKHLRTHIGENTYKCEQCDMAFRLQAELKNHRMIHYQENINVNMKKTCV